MDAILDRGRWMRPLESRGPPSLRRQHLVAEFAGLKQACPEGMFVSITPGNPALWSAVLFVRDGPYAPAVLRFLISFPDSYPQLPPRVSFSTDMFHPLITPLSTYMYTTDIQDNGTVSASDDERLPPGAFSLRHGFPDWFGHGRRTAAAAATSSSRRPSSDAQLASPPTATHISPPVPASSRSARAPPGAAGSRSPYDVLRYVRSTFDDERVLDSVPLDAAGNPGAWHAWRTHRRKLGPLAAEDTHDHAPDESAPLSQNPSPASPRKAPPVGPARHPGEWNWAGVWEDRVRRCIAASLSEPALYGAGAGPADDLIHFLPLEEHDVDSIKGNLRRSLGMPDAA